MSDPGNSTKDSFFDSHDGKKIFYRFSIPASPKAVIMFLHGISEHSGRYKHVMEHLSREGIVSYAPDHRGHGQTDGPVAYVKSMASVRRDIACLRDVVSTKHPGLPLIVFGHSMGGLIALYTLLEFQDLFDGAILSGPAASIPDNVAPVTIMLSSILSRLAPRLPVQKLDYSRICSDPVVREAHKRDKLVYHGKIKARTGRELLKTMKTVEKNLSSIKIPLLVMQGGQDSIIPVSSGKKVYDSVSSTKKRYKLFENMYHEIVNEPQKDKVFNEIISFIDDEILN